MIEQDLLRGFMLVRRSSVQEYRGIDRSPFLPVIIQEEIDLTTSLDESDTRIWRLYPAGWRRDAYEIYERNLFWNKDDNDPFLLTNIDSAKQILHIIEPELGPHEILDCELWDVDSVRTARLRRSHSFLGFDAAYRGGDFLSAVRAGLFGSPWFGNQANANLVAIYKEKLNNYGLFSDSQSLIDYVSHFKKIIAAEADSRFWLWKLVEAQ